MKKFIIPLVFILTLFFLFIYINAGGFEDVKITEKKSDSRYIVGKPYKGNVKNEKFSTLFVEIQQLKESQGYKGNLGAVYFNNPEKEKDSINAFLGVIMDKKIDFSPDSFEVRKLESIEVVEGTVKASNVFGISISKVYNSIFSFAEKNNLKLEEYYIEWFPNKDELVVQIKIKK